jgi:hypothetical protein
VRDEHDQDTEQQTADHIGDRVGSDDHERDRHECEPHGQRHFRAGPDEGEQRRNHDRADRVPTRVRIRERRDVDPSLPVRPVERRAVEEVLADQLDHAARKPRSQPYERRREPATPHERSTRDCHQDA